jgi:hypothetical protein
VPEAEVSEAELTFLRELRRLKVRFMVVGMSAAIIQGAPSVTEALDLWFPSLSDPNIDIAARKAGGVLAWRASPPAISGRDLDHIDIVTRCDGLRSFDLEYVHAKDAKIFDLTVKALPIEGHRQQEGRQPAKRPGCHAGARSDPRSHQGRPPPQETVIRALTVLNAPPSKRRSRPGYSNPLRPDHGETQVCPPFVQLAISLAAAPA